MFNELALSGLNESAGIFSGPMDPRIGDITLEGANDIGGLDAMDYALQSIYEFRSNMMHADMAAVCEEYAYLKSNGVEMVEEAALDTIKEWFSKAKDFIVGLGKRIADFFKTVLDKLIDATKGDGLWLKAHEKKINDLPSTVKLAKGVPGFNYNQSNIVANYDLVYNTIGDVIFMIKTGGTSGAKQVYKANLSDYEDTKSNYDNLKNIKKGTGQPGQYEDVVAAFKEEYKTENVFSNIMKKIGVSQPSKGNVKTIAQFKEALVQSIKDDATVFTQVSNVQAMVTELENGQEQRKKIKKCFEDNKKNLNNALKVVTQLEKNTEKGNMLFEMAKIGTSYMNTALSALVTANRVITQAFEANRAQNKKLINAAISTNKKDQKLEESALYYGGGDLI